MLYMIRYFIYTNLLYVGPVLECLQDFYCTLVLGTHMQVSSTGSCRFYMASTSKMGFYSEMLDNTMIFNRFTPTCQLFGLVMFKTGQLRVMHHLLEGFDDLPKHSLPKRSCKLLVHLHSSSDCLDGLLFLVSHLFQQNNTVSTDSYVASTDSTYILLLVLSLHATYIPSRTSRKKIQ